MFRRFKTAPSLISASSCGGGASHHHQHHHHLYFSRQWQSHRVCSAAAAQSSSSSSSFFHTAGKVFGAILPFAFVWAMSDRLLAPVLPDEFVIKRGNDSDKKKQPVVEVHTPQKNQLGGPFGKIIDCHSGKLVDHNDVFAAADDTWSLLYFGFSKCAEVCPRNLNFLTKIVQAVNVKQQQEQQQQQSSAARPQTVQIVFVSVDPVRDSPQVLDAYLQQRLPSDVPWRGLCGSEEQVAALAKAWRVYYSSVGETDEERRAREAKGLTLEQAQGSKGEHYQLDHSAAVYFVAPGGKLRDLFFDEMGVKHAVDRIDLHLSNSYGFDDK